MNPRFPFEFAYDTAKIAKRKKLFNTFVTNGYIMPESLKAIPPYLDAATVDFKWLGNLNFHRKYMSVPDASPSLKPCLK